MMMIMSLSFIIVMINIVLIIMLNLISKKKIIDREKSSPFECGFDPKSSCRIPFSLHFFLIALIFLIFDIEITLLFPFIVTMKLTNLFNYMVIFTFFIMILLFGLYHEWNQGALNWNF